MLRPCTSRYATWSPPLCVIRVNGPSTFGVVFVFCRHGLDFDVAFVADQQDLFKHATHHSLPAERTTENRLLNDEAHERCWPSVEDVLTSDAGCHSLLDRVFVQQWAPHREESAGVLLGLQKPRHCLHRVQEQLKGFCFQPRRVPDAGYCARATSSFNAISTPPAPSTSSAWSSYSIAAASPATYSAPATAYRSLATARHPWLRYATTRHCGDMTSNPVGDTRTAQLSHPSHHFEMRFSSTPRGARLARRLCAERLHAWGIPHATEAHDTLALLAAELAANAVRHGRVPGRDFLLRLIAQAATVRVEVTDTRGERLPEPHGRPSRARPHWRTRPAAGRVPGRPLGLVPPCLRRAR